MRGSYITNVQPETERLGLSSPEFVSKLRDQDRHAIEIVVKKYTRTIYRAALGLGFGQSQADDLVQTVWATFFEKVPNFEGRSHVRTYIFGILYNKAKELRRDQAKNTSIDPFDEVMAHRFDTDGKWTSPPMDPERFASAVETSNIIEECMNGLPTTQKMAFFLKELESNTTDEICKILSVTATNLGVLIYRARNGLRDCIEGKAK